MRHLPAKSRKLEQQLICFFTLWGQRIQGHVIIRLVFLNQPVRLKCMQPIRQQVGCNAFEACLQVFETRRACVEIAQDQQCPAITNVIQRPRNRAKQIVAAWIGNLSSQNSCFIL